MESLFSQSERSFDMAKPKHKSMRNQPEMYDEIKNPSPFASHKQPSKSGRFLPKYRAFLAQKLLSNLREDRSRYKLNHLPKLIISQIRNPNFFTIQPFFSLTDCTMNLLITRTPLLYFGYRIQKPKSARLQRLATKQELIFASFNQPIISNPLASE